MQQHAIIFNKDNAEVVADSLTIESASDLLEEHGWYLDKWTNLVLCKDVLEDGFAATSYVVTYSMFEANTMPVANLNDKTYTFVRNV